ncbi:MAG: ABC transporter substrate-binding protein, partial [Betaproteobacteria bacterium]|nr:ABC transporter substrate-binding protein [Betaproteobacteria bacterium]
MKEMKVAGFQGVLLIGLLAGILGVTSGTAGAAGGKTFRWASAGDILTLDPQSQNEGLNNPMTGHIYEPLVLRDRAMQLEPGLAVSWQRIDANTMRFKLREKVVFHDGAPFTADDAVFSLNRSMEKNSDYKAYIQGIKEVKKVDNLTLDIICDGPNPTLLDQLTQLRIMNKAWATKHNVVHPQDFKAKEETYAVRNTNGTGPYMLKSREADVKTVFVANPNWWGKRGNVEEIIYTPIKSDATRVAALVSGEIDFILDPPVQDIARLKENKDLKIVEGNEYRTIFIAMDEGRNELLYGSKGKNPFKDLRVRQAMLLAIDSDAIHKSIMRGLSLQTMSMIAPQVRGYSKDLEKRPAPDLAKAKQLMAAAGFADGFDVTFDCPNDRYKNDEKICTAISAMLARIGIRIRLNAMPKAIYFPKIQSSDTSMYLYGWG